MEHLSLVTTPIYLYNDRNLIQQGSGFYCASIDSEGSVIFLITNYHVLTGNSPIETGNYLGNNIKFYIHEDPKKPDLVREITLPLFSKNNTPIWITSKNYPNADIAAIFLTPQIFHDISALCISSNYFYKNMTKRPTSKVTMLGYPYNFFDSVNYLPIYKSGNIASEPDVDFSGLPIFIIDISSFPGMSGAPVFLIGDGAWQDIEGNMVGGYKRELLGVFSSNRIHKDFSVLQQIYQNQDSTKQGVIIRESMELGFVWKTQIIKDIFDNFDIDEYRKIVPPNDIIYKETKK